MHPDNIRERAVDQLVDEMLDRLSALDALVRHAGDDPSLVRSADVRGSADHVVGLLLSPGSRTVAPRVVDALWSPTPRELVPPTWWRTPLGQLLAGLLGDESSSHPGAATSPAPPRPDRSLLGELV